MQLAFQPVQEFLTLLRSKLSDSVSERGRPAMTRCLSFNHGGRDTIEAFDLDQMSTHPHLTWVGCIPEPAHTYGDAVSELSDGGVVATSTFDPADHDIAAKVLSGKPVGSVNEWHKGSGWASLVGTERVVVPERRRLIS